MQRDDLPLARCRVLDLADEATVFATRLLVDLGADVVRLESPRADSIRTRGPFLDARPGAERSFQHFLFNAGKRSVTADMDNLRESAVARRLLRWAQVVVAPMNKTPSMEAFLDSERLAEEFPGLTVIDTCFQRSKPSEPGSDLAGVAAGGLLWLNGFPSDPPNYPAGFLAHKQASLAAAFHAAVAFLSEARGHRPRKVQVSLQEAVTSTIIQSGNQNAWIWQNRNPGRTGGGAGGGPSVFQGRDGKWVSFVIPPPYWSAFADWVHETDGGARFFRPEWASPQFRLEKAREISTAISELCEKFTARELVVLGQARHLLVCPVNSVFDLAKDEHLRARGFFASVDEPDGQTAVRLPQSPLRFADRPSPTRSAPRLGGDGAGAFDPAPRLARAALKDASLPLAGIRVLDFCWLIAGPLGTRLLADLGAEVIKVESSARLDRIREGNITPPSGATVNTAPVFNDCNTSKKSLVLNLGTPEGLEIAKQLAAHADVVTSNFTPDRMDRWGLGYEALKSIKPDLIVGSLPVMGKVGPHSSWGAYGNGVIAMSGISSLTGFPDRPPVGLGTLHSDFTAPYMFATQIVAALVSRERNGEGQFIELAQFESAVALLDTELAEALNGVQDLKKAGNRSRFQSPHGVFRCAGEDSWVAFGIESDEDWKKLCLELGRHDLAARDDLTSLAGRKEHEDEIEEAVAAWASARHPEEATSRLRNVGIVASPVLRIQDLVESPDTNEFFIRLQHPECGPVLTQHQPVTYDDERLPLQRAPLFGEHTREVLSNLLGMSDNQIAGLSERGVLS
ncbi:MAG: CoA transferase [Dehalococcoidia bacterium]